jgi:hypothetical protein
MEAEFKEILDQVAEKYDGDDFSLAIKGHQCMETIVNRIISESLPIPHAVEIERLSFITKVDLSIAMGCLDDVLRSSFIKANQIRNHFAHAPSATLTVKQARDLLNSLPKGIRSALKMTFKRYENLHDLMRECLYILLYNLKTSYDRIVRSKIEMEVLQEMAEERLKNFREKRQPFVRNIEEETESRIARKISERTNRNQENQTSQC